MIFITENDIDAKIKENILQDITEVDYDTSISGITMLDEVELVAIHEIKSYIGNYYDCDTIFSYTGSTRDSFIVKMVVDIMLYELSSRLTPENIPEVRQLRYDRVIESLEKINAGKITLKLPILDQDVEDTGGLYLYSDDQEMTDW